MPFDPAALREEDEAPPPRILHSRDVESGAYDYNFIDYQFAEGIGARLYLDEPRAVHVGVPRSTLARPEAAAVLVYLQRRFEVIRCLESEGYVENWRAY